MKRIVPLLLILLLTAGCMSAAAPASAAAAAATEVPAAVTIDAPAPAATAEPEPEAAPEELPSLLFYRFEDGWPEGSVLFRFDLDQDGIEEEFSLALRPDDEWATAVSMGDSRVILAVGDEPVWAEVVDLDPTSPFYNLLMVFDYGSDSYVTVELHPENGELVQGLTVYGGYRRVAGGLRFGERSDLLGTNFGYRTYRGDDLIPDSAWLDMNVPTEEELKKDLESLIDVGTVIHCVKAVPCVIDGKKTTLPAETYLYCQRFMDPDLDLVMEVCTLDGTVAQLLFYDDEDEPHDPDRISTLDRDEYFDNLFYGD
jgi:hypothetical protein